jgi:hypothetical protein
MLILFAPQTVNVLSFLPFLREQLSSPHNSIRKAAVVSLQRVLIAASAARALLSCA